MPVNTGYQSMLSNAQSQYQGILAGYSRALSGQQAAQQKVMSGYNTLSANVLGGLVGSTEGRSQEIADYYWQQAGAANQQLINRGLGNTTVASSVGRGMAYDQTKAQTQLTNAFQQQRAQYQTQLGLAGLGYQGQAVGQNTALQGAALGYQADWQRSLLGAGMQGAALDQQYQLGQMHGGGGYRGSGGGGAGGYGGLGSSDAAWEQSRQRELASARNNEMIDLNAGMWGGGGGGWGNYGMAPGQSFASGGGGGGGGTFDDQPWYDMAFSAAGVEGY